MRPAPWAFASFPPATAISTPPQRQLVQLFREARGKKLAEPVWQRQGRFFDAQRPAIEPEGFDTAEEVLRHRSHHLVRAAKAMKST